MKHLDCLIHKDSFKHKQHGCMKCLAERQIRKVVNKYEFAGYRWNKLKFGTLNGKKGRTG